MLLVSFRPDKHLKKYLSSKYQYSLFQANEVLKQLKEQIEVQEIVGKVEMTIFNNGEVIFRDEYVLGEGYPFNILVMVQQTLTTTFQDVPEEEKMNLLDKLLHANESKESLKIKNDSFFKKVKDLKVNALNKIQENKQAKINKNVMKKSERHLEKTSVETLKKEQDELEKQMIKEFKKKEWEYVTFTQRQKKYKQQLQQVQRSIHRSRILSVFKKVLFFCIIVAIFFVVYGYFTKGDLLSWLKVMYTKFNLVKDAFLS